MRDLYDEIEVLEILAISQDLKLLFYCQITFFHISSIDYGVIIIEILFYVRFPLVFKNFSIKFQKVRKKEIALNNSVL